ncbi:MAG: MYXO-CTERM sorting domain-containing protein [Nannocystaceae bacterium]
MSTLRRAPFALALLLTGLTAVESAAAPIELVDKRRNYWVYDDVDGSVEHANWFSRDPFFVGWHAIEDGYLATHADDSQFVVIYSTFKLVQGVGAFYQSLENDVHGIGYELAADIDAIIPAPYFDDTPKSQIFGFLHMNDWHNFLLPGLTGLDETWISLVFGQELGHAWLSFVRFYDDQQQVSTSMLGRALAHWSFYLHTGGSPIQGHDWVDNGDGTFTAQKHDAFQYSDLDLYLMGLMPADEVEPWFLIEDPHDCIDSAKDDKSCAPADAFQFQADSYTVSGTRRDLTIKQVLDFEGPRVPAYPDAPNKFDISFLLIKRPDEVLCDDELEAIEAVVERSIEMWVDQTRGRATLTNRTASDSARPGVSCSPTETTGGETTGSETTGGTTSSTTGDATTTTDAGTSTSTGATSSEETDSATSSSTGGEIEPGGCACRSDAGARSSGLLALVGLLALGRRRRRVDG